jgi:predicted MFS family arabinose efflux permease
MELVAFLNKWIHLLSVITVLGGTAVMCLSVLPVLQADGSEEGDAARRIWRGFGILMGIAWLLVLGTGFFNLFLVSANVNKGYHMVVGMKMALALLMFGLAMIISHPLPALSGIQRNRTPILMVIIALGVVIVGMSANLNLSRISGKGLDAAKPQAPPPAVTSPPA